MQLAPVRLSELHSDLKIQEKEELQWKKLKAEGMDEDGEREAKLRRNFNSRLIFGCVYIVIMTLKNPRKGLINDFCKCIKLGNNFS